jgi:hypothetical protein
MPYKTIDLTDEVLAIKRLDAAAVIPNMLAFASAGAALLVLVLDIRIWDLWLSMICAAVSFAVIGGAIERGHAWAVWLITAAVSALSLFAILGVVVTTGELITGQLKKDSDSLALTGGSILLSIPAWMTIRHGLKAVWHRRRPALWIKPKTRKIWSQLPRDGRLRVALHTFAGSLFIGIGGLVVAGLVGAATGHALFAAFTYWPFARWAGRSWTQGKRALSLRVQEVRKLDSRPPVLLLRSFEDDNRLLSARPRLLWFFHAAKEASTLEDYVVNCVWKLGPVIAIGKPGENISPLGAARDYVEENQWRDCIRNYLDESAYLISILGLTPGLRWEYEQINARDKQDTLIVVFPPKPYDQLQRSWEAFQTCFSRAATIDLPFGPNRSVPLLALFRGADTSPLVLRCVISDEIAYDVAFGKLFECLETPVEAAAA